MTVERERSRAPALIVFGVLYALFWMVVLLAEGFQWWRATSGLLGLYFIGRGIYAYARARRYYEEEDARIAREYETSA